MANYSKGDGGYRLPVITDPERICIKLDIPNDPDHKAAFWGALWTLAWYTSWQKDDDKRGRDVAAVWRDVWFKARAANVDWDACLDCPDENECVEYSPQYVQEWYPNNPYTTSPGAVGWYIAPSVNILGVPAGVVVTDVLLLPIPDIATTRCRFYFSGTGTVEIHWHTTNLGGLAQVQLDGDILKLSYVDLASNLTSAPPEQPAMIQTEYTFEIPGEHFIDITMLPVIDSDIEFVRFGGGIVKIVLCGFDTMIITPQFRFTALCGMEQSNNSGATWNPIPGWDTFSADCFTGADGATGATGATGPTGAQGSAGADCACPDTNTEDEGGVPNPTGTPGDDLRCETAARAVNSIIDKLYVPWLNDAAYALYTQGLTAAQLGNQAETFLYENSGADFSTTTGSEYFWQSWVIIWGTVLAGTGIAARVMALTDAYAALDIIAVRDNVQTADAREVLICALYNNLNEDGSIDAATFANFKASVQALTVGIAVATRDDFLRFLNNAVTLSRIRAAARDATANTAFDCVACETEFDWCKRIDLRASLSGFQLSIGTSYEAGVGIKSGNSYYRPVGTMNIFAFDRDWGAQAGTVVGIKFKFSGQRGIGGDTNMAISLYGPGGFHNMGFDYNGVDKSVFIPTPAYTTYRVLTPFVVTTAKKAGAEPPDYPTDGNFTLHEVVIYGTGTPPNWAETEVC